MCRDTFDRFINDYPTLVDNIRNNIYAIPEKQSTMDFATYKKIFDDYDHEEVVLNQLNNIQGAISVNEKYINPFNARQYFSNKLSDIIIYENISTEKIEMLSTENDLVINCTNNAINLYDGNSYSENCEVLIYKRLRPTDFGALTFVDGDLFSIFPYLNDLYTVTHVKYTPRSDLSTSDKCNEIEKSILNYYPEFKKDFEFFDSFVSDKIKVSDRSDPRVPVISVNKNIVSCFTGKIQGIYMVQDFVEELCKSL